MLMQGLNRRYYLLIIIIIYEIIIIKAINKLRKDWIVDTPEPIALRDFALRVRLLEKFNFAKLTNNNMYRETDGSFREKAAIVRILLTYFAIPSLRHYSVSSLHPDCGE